MTEGIPHLVFQPMPYIIPAHSVVVGGNILGMNPHEEDRMWMKYDISWLTSAGDADADSMARNITESVDEYAQTTSAGVASPHFQEDAAELEQAEYKPIFLNDAIFDQLPLQSSGNDKYDRLKAIQREVDPLGFFPGRTGGFKLT